MKCLIFCYCRTFSQTGFQVKSPNLHAFDPNQNIVPIRSCRRWRIVLSIQCQNIIERDRPLVTKEYFPIMHTHFSFPKVELVRRRTPVLLQVYLTTGLFVIVSWISFIVPPEVVPGTNKTFLNGPRIVQSSCYIHGVWGFVWAIAFVLMRFMWSITRDYENLWILSWRLFWEYQKPSKSCVECLHICRVHA